MASVWAISSGVLNIYSQCMHVELLLRTAPHIRRTTYSRSAELTSIIWEEKKKDMAVNLFSRSDHGIVMKYAISRGVKGNLWTHVTWDQSIFLFFFKWELKKKRPRFVSDSEKWICLIEESKREEDTQRHNARLMDRKTYCNSATWMKARARHLYTLFLC